MSAETTLEDMRTVFETDRLSVRPLTDADLLGYTEMQSDPEVMHYTLSNAMDASACRTDLTHVMQQYDMPGNALRILAVTRKSDHHWMGTCILSEKEPGVLEAGYRLRREFWQQGYGTEVFEGLLHHAFVVMKSDRVVAETDIRNTASRKIIEKKMHFESEFYNTDLDSVDRLYGVSSEEYGQSMPPEPVQ